MTTPHIKQLNAQQLADILADTTISDTLDLGTSIVHRGTHSIYGTIALVATCGERHAMLNAAE